MSEYLPFWPKAAIAVSVTAATDQYVNSRALPTNGFTEVVAQLQLDAKILDSAGTATVTVIPQISNDGVNWKDLTAFTGLTTGTTPLPYEQTLKITDVGAFMRMRIKFVSSAGTTQAAATILLSGVGRS